MEYVKAVYWDLAYLTYMQKTMQNARLDEALLESRLLGEISVTSDMQMIPPYMAESKEEPKSLLMKLKEKSEKAGLNINIQNTKIIASSPITSWQIDREKVEEVTDFILLASKITADGDCRYEIKTLAPWKKNYDKPK